MHIKKVEIDGFKSYAHKQVVDKFDEQFNAITGLNGSGKSNILDSICFVLGITDLKCIRAENMNALVYKSGQAGITKASVTITFDNTDKANGPLGYNNYDEIIVRRQVIVNGRNSYTINGSAITNTKVSDFFRGVGLNVNNPHFLIMQGRITKVLNMKPHEILGMVEEAAGTKMYEQKRQQAVGTIDKKQSKVDEINRLLENDIIPQVEKLRQDRQNFQEYKKCDRDLEGFKKKLSAFQYSAYLQCKQQSVEEVGECDAKITEIDTICKEAEEASGELAAQLADLEQQKQQKNASGRSSVEEARKNAQEVLVGKQDARDEVIEEMKTLKKEIDSLKKSIDSDSKELAKQQQTMQNKEGEVGGDEERGIAAEKAVKLARAKLEAIAKGMTTDDKGNSISLEQQVTSTRTELSTLQTAVKTAEMKQKRILPELNKKRKEMDSLSKSNTKDSDDRLNLEREVVERQTKLDGLNYSEDRDNQLRNRLNELKGEHYQVTRKMTECLQRDTRIDFQYKNPWPGFDREKEIRGVFCTLFRVKDPKYALAIETACGSAMYNVVVAHQKTAAAMVDKNCLQTRRTFIPLDKVNPSKAGNYYERLNIAKKLAEGYNANVVEAIDLIEFDPIYQKVMEYVFNQVLVFDQELAANQICFNPKVKLRTVTLLGTDNRASGSASGGAADKKTPLLFHLIPFLGYRQQVAEISDETEKIETELGSLESQRSSYQEQKQFLERSKAKLQLILENLKNSPLEILKEEISNLENELPECEEVLRCSSDKMKELKEKIKEYEYRKNNEKEFQEKEKKNATKELEAAEKLYSKLKGSADAAKNALDTIRQTISELKEQIEKDTAEVTKSEDTAKQLAIRLVEREKDVKDAQDTVNNAQTALDRFLGQLKDADDQIKKVQKKVDSEKKKVTKLKNEKDDCERKRKKAEDDIDGYKKMAAEELKKNPWIKDVRDHFGQKGTEYDFTDYTVEKGTAQLSALQARKAELEKKLNTKAMNILGQAEEQVLSLTKKKEQIEKDKTKILETIERLDERKRNEIFKAHEQVDRDFGNIFSTLLPGTTAKLSPPHGKTVLDGLEVKVAFNGKWKDSLNELSGGQRSLVALSLVLAMLKFKPAPIYILDEVDSALDLSHTQNIGHMIKKHFTNSQFIIVSLKEGMFNHANVLYRTKFVDGTSHVSRTENRT